MEVLKQPMDAMDFSDPRVYALLEELSHRYPDIRHWYRDRILPRSQSTVRISLGCLGAEVCGISIADLAKNKLCTLYVREPFRGKGLGNLLMSSAFTFLNTCQPYFTCSEEVVPAYASMIERYNWSCSPYTLMPQRGVLGGPDRYFNPSQRRVTLHK